MAFDFDEVKETVRAIAVRLDSPSSDYNLVFSESDEAVEVRIEDFRGNIYFSFVVDTDRFRVVKALEIDPDGYSSFTYHSCVELLSYIVEYFYPVFYRLSRHASILDMLSRVLGEKVRIWKDLISAVCKAGDVEYFDFGHTVSMLDVNFSFNSDFNRLEVSGDLEDSVKCRNVMELVTALFTFMAFLFKKNDIELNPILGTQLVNEGFDFDGLEDTMAMGSEIDDLDVDMDMDVEGMGEDLSDEFVPAEEGLESTTPDIGGGKEAILDDVLEA